MEINTSNGIGVRTMTEETESKYAKAIAKAQREYTLLVLIHVVTQKAESMHIRKDTLLETLSRYEKYYDYALVIELGNPTNVETIYLKE